YLYYQTTNDQSIFDDQFSKVALKIYEVFKIEQNHEELSDYRFIRTNQEILQDPSRVKYETLPRNGLGTPVHPTGLIWSGFRPSDDACQYGYLIPSNMFAVVILKYLAEIFECIYIDKINANKFLSLSKEIAVAIEKHGIVNHPLYGNIYAYEVDGLGNYLLMDDANVPSLLSAPYLGYLKTANPVYQNTRKFILSTSNPFYYQGKVAQGVGSPHTPRHHIWHISLAIQGLTSISNIEKLQILAFFKSTDADTNLMHEGFHVDNPFEYSRPWFSCANSMFAEFLMSLNGIYIKGSPLESDN
ncbi:MAG: glycoside hydrolase family 125 protein, partial [Acholeplasmataceae bacterium]|nr:glycoside hydrolase family 125 protein [Acholeplasmataceae bacterium]